jgi:hypothetical protein
MDAVAKAAPDGYTLVMTDTSIAVNPSLKPLPYDTLKDFEPVSLLAAAPVILMAHPKVPVKTLQEFVALAKAQPGKFNYASGGNGASTHLGGELLKLVAGIDVVHVPYKGTGPAMNDLIGGHVDVMFSGISSARPYMDAGTLRALAVTGETRNAATPDVPTFAEAGLAGVTGLDLLGRARPEGHAEGCHRAGQRGIRQGSEGSGDRRTHRAARLSADRRRSGRLRGEPAQRDREVWPPRARREHQGRLNGPARRHRRCCGGVGQDDRAVPRVGGVADDRRRRDSRGWRQLGVLISQTTRPGAAPARSCK